MDKGDFDEFFEHFTEKVRKWRNRGGGSRTKSPPKPRDAEPAVQKQFIKRTQRHHNISFKKLKRNSK